MVAGMYCVFVGKKVDGAGIRTGWDSIGGSTTPLQFWSVCDLFSNRRSNIRTPIIAFDNVLCFV